MSVRTHTSLPWKCCGVEMPAYYHHCPYCGTSVVELDKVWFRVPTRANNGDLVIASNTPVSLDEWEMLSRLVSEYVKLCRLKEPSARGAQEQDA